jgi:LuxR family maltose regulon positive regulatory protein
VRAADPQTTDQPGASERLPVSVLVETKFHPPRHDQLVPRPALLARLIDPEPRKLTTLIAPPGWGKTTLLTAWREKDRHRTFTWLSLDGGDSDPVRFWRYVVEALRRIEPTIGEQSLAPLGAPGTSLVEAFVPLLLNEVTALERPTVLVLDDYHLVTSAHVSASFSYFLDHLPQPLSLALATRSEPPLPLARMRVTGELLEVRLRELRFTTEEAAVFLNDLHTLDLAAEDVERLQSRTEGWAAGLYLAALSLRRGGDARAFVDRFTGDDRNLVDYLGAEVLERESEDVRRFLLRTSILSRLCASLCEAVAEVDDGKAMLSRIERTNLLLIPLDARREWYRYHHLFGEMLAHELQRSKPELVPRLHRSAFEWYRAHDALDEAIRHAVLAGDTAAAVALIAANWLDVFNDGGLATVTTWLDSLPTDVVSSDPRLCIARAWVAVDRGRLDDADRWTQAAERALESRPEAGNESAVRAAALRVLLRFKRGDIARTASEARRVLELGGQEPPFSLIVARCLLGVASYWSGETDTAAETFEAALEAARASGNELASIYAGGYLALIACDRGDLDRASALIDETIVAAEGSRGAEHFVAMIGHLAHGRVALTEGRIGEAEGALARSVELARRGAGRIELAAALAAYADVRRLARAPEEAARLLDEARALVDASPDPGRARERVERAAQSLGVRQQPPQLREPLSQRERAVLELLPTSLSQREIGNALYISLNTVKSHTRSIFRKLGAADRDDAVARAQQLGLLDPSIRPGAR